MRIPVLLYHALFEGDSNREKYAIRGEEFERHVRYLSENGFRALLVDEFCKPARPVHENGKAVLITFDDGNLSDYSIAFPILNEYGLPATFFVTVSRIGTENFTDWPKLKEMISNGASVQSHGLTHSFLSDICRDDLMLELNESKAILGEKLNSPVSFLSLPGGFCSKIVLELARELGYKGVCTSAPGLNVLNGGADFPVLKRFVITRKTSFEDFKGIVSGDRKKVSVYRMRHQVKRGLQKVLGAKRYHALWKRFLSEI